MPRDLEDLQDFFANFADSAKTPSWFLELLDMLLPCEDPDDRRFGLYRESSLPFSATLVLIKVSV